MSTIHSDLLCKNGCGFYGNAEQQWFCSKCWREHRKKVASPSRVSSHFLESPRHDVSKGATPKQDISPKKSSSGTGSGTSSSDKRQTLIKNTKQLFGARMNSPKVESPEKSPRKSPKVAVPQQKSNVKSEVVSKEHREVSNEIATFLHKKLEKQAVKDVSIHVKKMVDKIQRFPLQNPENIEDLSVVLQDFYNLFQQRLQVHQLYKGLSEEDSLKIMELSEKYITVDCYKQLFCPSITSDEEKDLEIQNKIRSLNWISTEHLNCSIDEFSQEVRDLLYQAINDLLEIDGQMAPQDKLACLVKCCKNIFEILKVSNENPASADDFLPCLIYICLKANPPRIQSNINYITRFCNESKIRMGEGGYFFANLNCATTFIENLSAESVNMDPEEFETYTSGKSVPLESWRSNLLMCEGLQKMSQNLKVLAELKEQQQKILLDAQQLQSDLDQFQTEISSEVDSVLDRTSYVIKKPSTAKEPIDLDAEIDTPLDLPAPLLPADISANKSFVLDTSSSGLNVSSNNMGNLTLEDYLSTSADNMSLMSLDMSSQMDSENGPESLSMYRGFSAQSSSIPSISCDSALPSLTSTLVSTSGKPNTEYSNTEYSATEYSVEPEYSVSSTITSPTQSETVISNSNSRENISTASSSPMVSAATSPETATASPDTEIPKSDLTQKSSSDEEYG